MRSFYIIILFALLSGCGSPNPTVIPARETELPTNPPDIAGAWIGSVNAPDGSSQSIVITVQDSVANLKIEPLSKTWSLGLNQTGADIELSVTGKKPDPFTEIKFSGNFAEGTLSGNINWDGTQTALTFTPIATVDPALLANYEGVYRLESGRAFSVILNPKYDANGLSFFHDGLTFTDFETGESRGIYPLDETTFAIGALRVVGMPFTGRIQFTKDAQENVNGLMWWDDYENATAENAQLAARVAFTYEDIIFPSIDGINLAGRFSYPESSEPLPVFVSLHGSEQGTRDNFGQKIMTHYMIGQGFAILTYDKRGVGDSDGIYVEAASQKNLSNHAADVTAGAEYLLTRPEVDASRIGLIGGSQAGWVIPIAADQSDLFSFFVILSGPVLSVGSEDMYSSVTNDGDTASNFDAEALNQRVRDFKPSGFDPLPILPNLNQKGLWLWGSVDKSVPAIVSAENLQKLIDSGKDNFSYAMFEGADHNLNFSPHGYFDEIPFSVGIAYCQTLSAWLKENILNK